jgi:hypothetical protein
MNLDFSSPEQIYSFKRREKSEGSQPQSAHEMDLNLEKYSKALFHICNSVLKDVYNFLAMSWQRNNLYLKLINKIIYKTSIVLGK